jgi:hypothetical protein
MGVMTAVAVGGVIVSGVSAGASFASASKQRKLQTEAEKDAQKAMIEAKSKLSVNYYAGLSVFKEPYELQREAALAQGAQAIEAGREAERGAASIAGRLQMAQNDAQALIRASMGRELMELEKLKAAEDSRLRDSSVIIDLQEAKGAQQASADAQRAATAYTQQGFSALTDMGKQAIQLAPLYGGGASDRVDAPFESINPKTAPLIPVEKVKMQAAPFMSNTWNPFVFGD